MGESHKVNTALLYNINQTIYVSAIKSAAVIIAATKLKNVSLIYKTEIGVYNFKNLIPRSISYNGHSLYAMNSEQEVQIVNFRKVYRLFVGAKITAKMIAADGNATSLYCILKDISAIGMGIVTKQKIDMLTKIEICFRVNRDRIEKLIGNIVHEYEFVNGKGFLYGCEFIEPNVRIARYIIKKQKEMNELGECSKDN
jgi:hypothetical protein